MCECFQVIPTSNNTGIALQSLKSFFGWQNILEGERKEDSEVQLVYSQSQRHALYIRHICVFFVTEAHPLK